MDALLMRIAQLPLALTLAHKDPMKHWLSTIRMNWGFRATLLVVATGGLFGCWTLSQALAEADQPLITLWTSESSPTQTNSRPPVYLAQNSRVFRAKELPSHRLPAIDLKPAGYGKPLVVANPFAPQKDQTEGETEPFVEPELSAPVIRHLPAPAKIIPPKTVPKTIVPKTIVPIPTARQRRAPREEVVDHLPYASAPLPPNLSADGIGSWSPPARVDDFASYSSEPIEKKSGFSDGNIADETWKSDSHHGEDARELWWQDGSDYFEEDEFREDEALNKQSSDNLPDTEPAFDSTEEATVDSNTDVIDIEEFEADWTLAPTMPNTPTVAEISSQVMPSVQKAYGLARRGALYASQAEFVAILRRICHAKDAELGTNEHARSLARGLRAMEEADDFMPVGAQLEADFDTHSVAKSHHTPVLHHAGQRILPHDAVAQYHAYAAKEIGIAVAGEQAGSMVLYGLGKIHNQIARSNDQDIQSVRKSMAMYQASLLAHPRNHLAANELGVLLAQAGHYPDAAFYFEKVVQLSPGSTAYRNLAAVQHKLGQTRLAAANEQHFQRLARWERSAGAVSRSLGVEWVSANKMARVGQPSQMPSARPPVVGNSVAGQFGPGVQTPRLASQQRSRNRKGNRNWPVNRFMNAAKSVASTGRGSNSVSQPRMAETPPKSAFWR